MASFERLVVVPEPTQRRRNDHAAALRRQRRVRAAVERLDYASLSCRRVVLASHCVRVSLRCTISGARIPLTNVLVNKKCDPSVASISRRSAAARRWRRQERRALKKIHSLIN